MYAIPKNAKNPVLAHLFLNYMMDEFNALKNWSWLGYQVPFNVVDPETIFEESYPGLEGWFVWEYEAPPGQHWDNLKPTIVTEEDVDPPDQEARDRAARFNVGFANGRSRRASSDSKAGAYTCTEDDGDSDGRDRRATALVLPGRSPRPGIIWLDPPVRPAVLRDRRGRVRDARPDLRAPDPRLEPPRVAVRHVHRDGLNEIVDRRWPPGPFLRTLAYVAISVAICLVVGYPVAYYIARYGGRLKVLLLTLMIAPFWMSYLMRMLAWVNLLADQAGRSRVVQPPPDVASVRGRPDRAGTPERSPTSR